MPRKVQSDGWKVRSGENELQDLTESQWAKGNSFICLKFSSCSFSCSKESEFAPGCLVTLLPRMFWKIAYQGKNSAILKLIVSISYMDSCLAWSYSKGRSLPENCMQSVQSHAWSLILVQLNYASLTSPSLQQGSSLQCSASPVFLSATCSRSADPCLLCQVSAGERPDLSNSPCEDCVCKDSGHCTVPQSLPAAWTIALGRVHHCVTLMMLCSLEEETHECLGFVAQLKIKLCMSDTGDGAWISSMKLLGVSSGQSQGLSFWSQQTQASFIWTLSGRKKAVAWARVSSLPGFPAWKVSCLAPRQRYNAAG